MRFAAKKPWPTLPDRPEPLAELGQAGSLADPSRLGQASIGRPAVQYPPRADPLPAVLCTALQTGRLPTA
ncbi:MAG: hypothetical protein Q7J98_13690 [Kiritimatiellia bacterium]|nr:hypothetical protein [Kiritimatiellia bacterium]